jgi:dTDP-4-amino-4,6-dideoxygalactose transaminase
MIPFVDLQQQFAVLEAEILAAIRDVCASGRFAMGPAVEQFEKDFAAYCGVRHCVGVNSGTSALHLALLSLDIGPGDEVITVPMTFVATAWAISYAGATPVFVDIDPDRRTMDPSLLEAAITERTRAILPVHLYGAPADMDPIRAIADRHGIPIVEDAAQAHGARYRGKRAGSLGTIGCFSFYPSKNLGAYGEGGALVTDDDRIASRVRSLRNHAQSSRNVHDEVGYNYRMDSIQGAVLRIKLQHLDTWNDARARLVDRYNELLHGVAVTCPRASADSEAAWHLYVVEANNRDELRNMLADEGIETGLHYPRPVHLQPSYRYLGFGPGMFPASESLADRCISLPFYPELEDQHVRRVAQALRQAVEAEPAACTA